jgi:glycerophosphoryl diester phosphodiesterase
MAITKDGVVVVHHDLWLNPDTTRGPDGQWLASRGPAIHDLTFDELQKYDVGAHQARDGLREVIPRPAGRGRDAHSAPFGPLRPA